MSKQEPSGEVPGVSVSGSQGIVAGTGNVQNNNWMHKLPLDPATLGALSPHTAVVRLQKLTHDELVDFFARASPDYVGEILEVFLETDRVKVVAALGDVNRRKATELIGAAVRLERTAKSIFGQFLTIVLMELPEAAEEIARKAASLRWTEAEPLVPISTGYTRKYKNGRVFWRDRFGAHTAVGVIDDYCTKNGPSLGCPIGDQETAPTSPIGTEGIRQRFQGSIVYSSKLGVFLITDAMCYENEGGSGGWLGFPVSEGQHDKQSGERQMFEGGAIYSYVVERPEGRRCFAVRREVVDALPDDRTWRPVSKVTHTVSSSGTPSAVQYFEVGLESGTCATAAYSSKHYGPVIVAPEIWDYYSNLDAEKSWLGFPVAKGAVQKRLDIGIQLFEGGVIYWQTGNGPIAVRKAVNDLIAKEDGLSRRLSFPVTQEQPMGTGESDRIQFFSGGVVTMRDGKYEIWLRPEPKADSKPESPLESDTTATSEDAPALPLVNYDELSVVELNLRLLRLSVEQVRHLLDYEKSNRARADVIATLEQRIALVEGHRKG